MAVNKFDYIIKKKLCDVIPQIPRDVITRRWCQNMFPRNFYLTFIYGKINKSQEKIICCKTFFDDLCKLNDTPKDSYIQCLLILLKYAALLYVNTADGSERPYYFLSFFKQADVIDVLLWEKKDDIGRTMFCLTEYLKFARIVFSTIISHLVTVSVETIPKCKNLIYYWKLLCGKPITKQRKIISINHGISEKDANKIRQIFEHIRISKSLIDDYVSNHSYSTFLRDQGHTYRNSEFVTTKKSKPGHKNIFIPITDNSSKYNGLLLFDHKKSKTFELDYLNSLLVYSLANDTEYILVDSLLFRHDLILLLNGELYDPLSILINPLKEEEKSINYFHIVEGINDLVHWSKIQVMPSDESPMCPDFPFKNPYDEISERKEKEPDSEELYIPSEDDYEHFSTSFTVAVKDSLLYHYQVGDIEQKYKKLIDRKKKATALSKLLV